MLPAPETMKAVQETAHLTYCLTPYQRRDSDSLRHGDCGAGAVQPDLVAINHCTPKWKNSGVAKACGKELEATVQPGELSPNLQLELVDVKHVLNSFI